MRNRYMQALYFSAGFGDFIGGIVMDAEVGWSRGQKVLWGGLDILLIYMKRSHQKTHITKGLYSI